jgi:hypothetical protein
MPSISENSHLLPGLSEYFIGRNENYSTTNWNYWHYVSLRRTAYAMPDDTEYFDSRFINRMIWYTLYAGTYYHQSLLKSPWSIHKKGAPASQSILVTSIISYYICITPAVWVISTFRWFSLIAIYFINIFSPLQKGNTSYFHPATISFCFDRHFII